MRGARLETDGTHKWYTRTFVFSSQGLKKVEENESTGNTQKPGNTNGTTGNTLKPGGNSGNTGSAGNQSGSPVIDKTPDSESKYDSDLTGSTSAVNNTTSLKDGVYTPDNFMWSGGTGRITISCDKITITNGQAYATIVFSSANYSYVKANGNVYYASHNGSTSVFTIPIELNKNNQIIGMTTAMSTAHEITYSIFVYLAETGETSGNTVTGTTLGSSKTLDTEAPEIPGLEYEEEVTLEYAEYFKIYKYENDITLLEIDMTTDTVREDLDDEADEEKTDDEELNEEETDAKESNTGTASASGDSEKENQSAVEEESTSTAQSKQEQVAELYQEDIVKYLIVPEDTEIPAGLDKEVIVIQQPVDKTYAAAEEIIEQMKQVGALDKIAAVGSEEEDSEIAEIAEGLKEKTIVLAGTFDEPDYKTLVKSKCNLAVLPADILPQKEDAETAEDDAATAEKADTAKAEKDDAATAEKDDAATAEKDDAAEDDTAKVEKDDAAKAEEKEDTLTAEEQMERLTEQVEKYALLEIPVVVDRSQDEKSEIAQMEWLKVYGVLFGCEEKADELFSAAVEKATKATKESAK
jgi:hypothetical protein